MHNILILNGPNLNLLGTREPDIYGKTTLDDIEQLCVNYAKDHGASISFKQSNAEAELIDLIHNAKNNADAIIINAGALTHTSIALHDALAAVALPVFEVHISNVYAREAFRHNSYISPVAKAVLCGFGPKGYIFALDGAIELLSKQP